jgi:hypothetical protein
MLKFFSVLFICLSISLYAETQKLLLITGCSRSGTTYVAEILSLAGLDIGHERLAGDGIASWTMAVDSDESPWGPASRGIHFVHIWQQVRHPLRAISSIMNTEEQSSWEFICKYIPEIKKDDSLVVKSAKYWYYWNLMAEEKAEWRYRVEDIDLVFNEMGQRLDRILNREALDIVPKTINTRWPFHVLTWFELKKALPKSLFSKIQKMAQRYGYDAPDPKVQQTIKVKRAGSSQRDQRLIN